jgi:hypothetical protein
MLDAIEITFEAQTIRIGILVTRPGTGADRTGRTGGEHGIELGFAFGPSAYAAPHITERLGMGAPNDDFFDLQVVDLHGASVTTRCDNLALGRRP